MGKALKLLKNRKVVLVVILAIAGMLALSYYLYIATDQVAGRVDHKTITGEMDGTSYSLVSWMPGRLDVLPPIKDLVTENATDLSVTQLEELEQSLQNLGYKLHYVVNIELSSRDSVNGRNPGDAEGYFTDRDGFNTVTLGDNVTFDVPHNEKNVIRNLR